MKNNYVLVSILAFFLSACGSSSKDNEDNNETSFQCDGRETCAAMDTYEEAVYFLKNCPNVTKLDTDNDKIPCEKKFNK